MARSRYWYWIGEVAEIMGVSKDTIRSWEKKGIIDPPIRMHGRRVWSREDIRDVYRKVCKREPPDDFPFAR